ncbi:MAG: fibronectin type III domain-containing protein [Cyclobacteriaceae bacterium]|nr:fibronectin type III domain-containing protein [Cyclobacteriaceae bacterium]
MKKVYRSNLSKSNQLAKLLSVSFLTVLLMGNITDVLGQCDVPSNLMTTNITGSGADLSWDAVEGAVSYTVLYKVSGAPEWTTETTGTNSLSLTGLFSGTVYTWKVSSDCETESSSFTIPPIRFTTTGSPACRTPENDTEQSLLDTSVTLNWNSVVGAVSYIVFYKELGQVDWVENNTTGSSLNLTGLTPETQYIWKVRSVCDNNLLSPFSQGNTFTTLPTCVTPTNLVAGNIMDNSADLSWDAVADAISYDVDYRVLGSQTWISNNVATTSLNLLGLLSGLTYQWRVRTICTGAVPSDYTAIQNFTTTGTPACAAPVNLAAGNIMDTSADLSWDVEANALTYSVQHRVLGASTWTTTSTGTNSLTLTGLSSGLTYQFKVRSECSGTVVSVYSDPVTFMTTGAPSCAAPVNLAAGNLMDTSADLSWDAATGAISYEIQFKLIGAPAWNMTTSGTNSLTLSSLLSGQNYQWRVRTVCSTEILSDYSSSTFFRTTGTPACAVPANPVTSSITETSAQLSWDAVTGAVNYTVFFKEIGQVDWQELTVASNSTTLVGLTAATSYLWKVRTICSADNSVLSEFTSPAESFTTDDAMSIIGDVLILDMRGNAITNATLNGETLNDLIQRQNLRSGLYIARIASNNEVTSYRFAIQ